MLSKCVQKIVQKTLVTALVVLVGGAGVSEAEAGLIETLPYNPARFCHAKLLEITNLDKTKSQEILKDHEVRSLVESLLSLEAENRRVTQDFRETLKPWVEHRNWLWRHLSLDIGKSLRHGIEVSDFDRKAFAYAEAHREYLETRKKQTQEEINKLAATHLKRSRDFEIQKAEISTRLLKRLGLSESQIEEVISRHYVDLLTAATADH